MNKDINSQSRSQLNSSIELYLKNKANSETVKQCGVR